MFALKTLQDRFLAYKKLDGESLKPYVLPKITDFTNMTVKEEAFYNGLPDYTLSDIIDHEINRLPYLWIEENDKYYLAEVQHDDFGNVIGYKKLTKGYMQFTYVVATPKEIAKYPVPLPGMTALYKDLTNGQYPEKIQQIHDTAHLLTSVCGIQLSEAQSGYRRNANITVRAYDYPYDYQDYVAGQCYQTVKSHIQICLDNPNLFRTEMIDAYLDAGVAHKQLEKITNLHFRGTLVHEFLHAFRLQHPHESSEKPLESLVYKQGIAPRTRLSYIGSNRVFIIGPDDIAKLEVLFGLKDPKQGRTHYRFTTDRSATDVKITSELSGDTEYVTIHGPYASTIHDPDQGDEQNLYDFSQISEGVDVDLAPGAFSYYCSGINRLYHNNGISYTSIFKAKTPNLANSWRTEITNCIGTEFADKLKGNKKDNYFLPLSGDDFIDGREGEDCVSLSSDWQGVKRIQNIEYIRFKDLRLSDLSFRKNGYKLYILNKQNESSIEVIDANKKTNKLILMAAGKMVYAPHDLNNITELSKAEKNIYGLDQSLKIKQAVASVPF